METEKRCETRRFPIGGGFDVFTVCEEVKAGHKEEKGSFWNWFLCVVACSNYDEGFDYDWFQDKCTCKGEWIPSMWK